MKKQTKVTYKQRIEAMRLCRIATSREVLDILNVAAAITTKPNTSTMEKNYVKL